MVSVGIRPFVTLHRRKSFSLIAAVLLLAFVASPGSGLAAAEPNPAAKERSEDFAWFSGLGYPDVKDFPLVRVATGLWSKSGDEPPKNRYVHGFLLGQGGDKFTVMYLDLATDTLTKSAPEAKEHERVGYELKSLPEFAAEYLQELGERANAKPGEWPRRFGETIAQRAEIFVLAWGCSRQGHDDAAADLYFQVARMPSHRGSDQPRLTLRQEIAGELAHAEMWRTVLQCGDTAVSRPQLLEAFERIVKNFPDSEHVKQAKENAKLLRQMIGEDREHAENRKAGKPFAELSSKEQIAELIFQLRDQNGHQWSQPGSCDVFVTDGKEDSPAHQLVKIGYDAVPQLIEALTDTRFSRSVGFHRDFYFSHTVLCVGDCAEQILSQIAGRSFYNAVSTSGYMHQDQQAAATKAAASAWYAELQAKGEKQLLLDETATGDDRAVYQAARLTDKYPDDALPALIAGARKSKEPWTRARLVALAGATKGDAPITFLLDELKNGPTRDCRLAAAVALHGRGRPEAVTAMIVEWNRPRDDEEDRFGRDDLVGFLAGCNEIEAVDALGRGLADRPVDVRVEVVSVFGRDGNLSLSHFGGAGLSPGKAPNEKNRPGLRAAVLKLLLAALDDTEERYGMSGNWNGKDFSDPRVCDVAGHVLSNLDEKCYAFDLSASLAHRDRDRLLLKNVLRKEQGLPELPLPESRVVTPVADEKVAPLLTQLEAADESNQESVEREIYKLGVGALPTLLKRLKDLTNDDPRRAKVDRLSRRLALLVVDVEITEKSLTPDAEIADRLAALIGLPFQPQTFRKLIATLIDKQTREIRGFRLVAVRDEGSPGVVLRLDLLSLRRANDASSSGRPTPSSAAPTDRPFSWDYNERVRVGREQFRHSSGGGTSPPARDDDGGFSESLEKVVAASPDQAIDIRLQVIGEWVESKPKD